MFRRSRTGVEVPFDPRAQAQALRWQPVVRWGTRYLERPKSYLRGRWEERHPLNVPGPFYGADTDTCCDGPPLAPASLLYDEHGQGFVWRQPRDVAETQAMLNGASSDPFSGYAWDGDSYWTPETVRTWWASRHEHQPLVDGLVEVINGPRPLLLSDYEDLLFRCLPVGGYSAEARQQMRAIVAAYLRYRANTMAHDLRRYLYFLDHGAYPVEAATLPRL